MNSNEYIQHVNRAIDDHDELGLWDVFDKQCAVSFLETLKNYLEKVKLINFDIIYSKTKLTELKEIYTELAKLQPKKKKQQRFQKL